MLEIIEKYADEHKVPIINEEGLDFLFECIKQYNVKSIFELGSAIGYSALRMSIFDPQLKIVTVEKDEERYELAVKYLEMFDKHHQIKLFLADALQFETNQKFDMMFLDLAKSKYQVVLDRFYDNLNAGGIVVVDNLGMHGLVFKEQLKVRRQVRQLVEKIKAFREAIIKDDRFEVKLFDDVGDGVALLIKKGV
ncbi:MAG: SAM-dependent methyltransferase [Erysipelothrix sp.]|nr:SAM-dependent methyltransferase [Erysipelothrix sp.]